MFPSGLPFISLESQQTKEATSAADYAKEALQREVHDRLALSQTAKISDNFVNLEFAILYALECVYTEDAWNRYLKAAGYKNASKKDAEIFINACAAKFVCVVLHPLMTSCRDHTAKWKAGLTLKAVASDLSDALDLALEELSKYPDTKPLYTFQQFQQEYPNVLQSLYDSL